MRVGADDLGLVSRNVGSVAHSLGRCAAPASVNLDQIAPLSRAQASMISVHYSYRAEMERINAFLAKADLKLLPEANTPEVVTARRHLIRYFKLSPFAADRKQTARFDLAGRLFGGWWQELPSGHRQAIRIDGEPIADLDFASMFLRLAYLKAGIAPPDGIFTRPSASKRLGIP